MLWSLLLLSLTIVGSWCKMDVNIQIHTDRSNASIKSCFVSISLAHKFKKWKGFNFGDVRMRNLAKALAPMSVRVLGNPTFPKDRIRRQDLDDQELILDLWNQLNDFVRNVSWEFSFDFINLDRTNKNVWITDKAEHFLTYASKNKIPIPDFQVGNEPNLYHEKTKGTIPSPKETVEDFKTFRELLKKYPMYKRSSVVGPDVTRPSSSRQYFQDFLKLGGCQYIDYFAYHQYYLNQKFNPSYLDFINISTLNLLRHQIHLGNTFMKDAKCSKPIRLTETSSISDGGLPDRADRYVAGFMWIHKIGVAALNGIDRIYRHNYFGSSYSLLRARTNLPNVDYYITLLFKRLVEGKVFEVTTSNQNVVAFANCGKATKDSLVLYLMNIQNEAVTFSIKSFEGHVVEQYVFSPGEKGNLLSWETKINNILRTDNGSTEIKISPLLGNGRAISLDPHAYGFFVIPNAQVKLCSDTSRSTSGTVRVARLSFLLVLNWLFYVADFLS